MSVEVFFAGRSPFSLPLLSGGFRFQLNPAPLLSSLLSSVAVLLAIIGSSIST